MKILVTGCVGFIGFHLSRKLILNGHTVIGIDSINDYYGTKIKFDRLKILKKNSKKFIFKKGDISNYLFVNKVFKELSKVDKQWKNKKIKARFICSLTIYWSDKKLKHSTGKVEGYISNISKGKNGFGYDPIFLPINKKITFGEMKSLEKYKIDHRFKAFKNIKKFF